MGPEGRNGLTSDTDVTFITPYPYLRADGVAVAHPLFQAGGGGAIPTSALQLLFGETTVDEARALNALWHSVLPQIHKHSVLANPLVVCYAAEYAGAYYASAIWTSPVAANRMRWGRGESLELRRFAIAPQAPKNSASRMLAYMSRAVVRKFPTLRCLISYQDTDHHVGTIYKAAGWVPSGLIPFKPWNQPKRPRVLPVSASPKVRWELIVKDGTGPPD